MNLGAMDIKSMMFDLDGTLIDSVPAYFQLMKTISDIVGLPRPPKPLVAEFMARGRGDVFEKMIPGDMKDRKEELIQEIMTVGRQMSYDMFRDEVEVFPGVRELFCLLAERGIPIGVVSSTDRRNIEKKLIPLTRIGIKSALARRHRHRGRSPAEACPGSPDRVRPTPARPAGKMRLCR